MPWQVVISCCKLLLLGATLLLAPAEQDESFLVELARAEGYIKAMAIACANARVRLSEPTGPTICTPIGMPFGPRYAGMFTHGPCTSVQVRLKAELEIPVRSVVASPHVLGVRMTSHDENISAIAAMQAMTCSSALSNCA